MVQFSLFCWCLFVCLFVCLLFLFIYFLFLFLFACLHDTKPCNPSFPALTSTQPLFGVVFRVARVVCPFASRPNSISISPKSVTSRQKEKSLGFWGLSNSALLEMENTASHQKEQWNRTSAIFHERFIDT